MVLMIRSIITRRIGAPIYLGLLMMQSSCSTESALEANCAIAKDQKNIVVQAMYDAAADKIRRSWAPDIGKREGALRTVQVSIQAQQAHRDFQYELNDLAYQTCLRGAKYTNK